MIGQVSNQSLNLATAALAANTPLLHADGNLAWRLQSRGPAGGSVSATLEDDWLALTVAGPLGLVADATPWNLLQRNATLPGLAKFALMPDGDLQLRAELPLIEDADLAGRVRETCDGFEFACAPYVFAQPDFAITAPAAQSDLKRLCTEAGWPFVERGPEKLLVELESSDGFRQAALVHSARGIQMSCELTLCSSLAQECRDAIAIFLLSASGVLRLARGVLAADAAQLEVAFAAPPCASEISSALESLSVGCSLCGEEIKTLQDPAIARHFLALQGRGAETVA